MRRSSISFAFALAMPFLACTPATNTEPATGADAGTPAATADAGAAAAGCVYPESTTLTGVGSVMPPLAWETAYMPEGNTINFDLEDVYCQRDWWAGTKTIFFVIVAEWCPNCPDYVSMVGGLSRQLADEGALIVFTDLETRSYALPTNESANAYVGRYTQTGLRVGEADSTPPGTIHDAGGTLWRAVPGTIVVRTSDMKIIANQEDSDYILPFLQIAKHPDADWSDPANPPFFANCGPSDEETYEPNNSAGEAAAIDPGSFSGGICDEQADYYRIDIAGDWRLDLTFSHAEGDLDVYVVDPTSGEPLMESGAPVGSAGDEDNESFTYSGPATIRVEGFNKASAVYTLTLTAL